jgi:hypothetical protein
LKPPLFPSRQSDVERSAFENRFGKNALFLLQRDLDLLDDGV